MAKVLSLNTDGSLQEVQPVTASAGAGDATKLAQLDSNGKFDISTMPSGIGADTQSINCTEALSAGDFVNIYNNAGAVGCRKALAADNTKPANGFVKSSFSISTSALVYLRGVNPNVVLGTFVVADVGSKVFLSPSTSGGCTKTIPATTGQVAQVLGTIDAVAATVSINFSENPFTVRA
jgi:hypothetical protein